MFAVPVVAGMAGALLVSRLVPRPAGFLAGMAWWLVVAAGAVLPVLLVERAVQRWLPLAVLLELSLVFADRTPSRLKVAQQAARTRDLKARLGESRRLGVHDEPTRAAERVLALIVSLGAHDRKTRGHSERVRVLADLLAEKVRVPKAERERFRWGALLHDLGKISVPPAILNKAGPPDRREWSILRGHPAEGARMAGPLMSWLGRWAGAIKHHHERYDGSGYPDGLAGKEISLGGRILAIADAYEVMTSARSYKRPMSAPAARRELARGAGTHFDPDLVRAFLDISVGRLIWVVGLVALLAQLPVIGRLWLGGVWSRFGRAVAHTATATALVAAVGFPGVVASDPPPIEGRRVLAQGASGGFPDRGTEGDHAERRGKQVEDGRAPRSAGSGPAGRPDRPSAGEPGGPPDDEAPPEQPPGEDEPAPVSFAASGRISVGNPASPRVGVTLNEFLLSCGTPASQGVDGWVFQLPATFSERQSAVSVQGASSLGRHDLDMRFFSAHCRILGSVSTESPNESGFLPGGTRFVVVGETRGIDTQVRLAATTR